MTAQQAHNAVAQALRSGVLVKGPCRDCGTTVKVQGHHPDHRRFLEVIWLCPKCHGAEHSRTRAKGWRRATTDLKLTLTAAQHVQIKRAAKRAGLKSGPWARSVVMEAVSLVLAVKAAPAPQKQPLHPMEGPSQPGAAMHSGGAGKLRAHSPLIKTYDPDQEKL